MNFVYASSIASASRTYSLTSASVAIKKSTKIQMYEAVYVLSEAAAYQSK